MGAISKLETTALKSLLLSFEPLFPLDSLDKEKTLAFMVRTLEGLSAETGLSVSRLLGPGAGL